MATQDPTDRPTEPPVSAFRASRAQQRMYFLHEMEEGRPTYHMPVFYALEGEVDTDVLRRCAQQLLDRHEALRTRFELRDGQLLQCIDASARLDWSTDTARTPEEVERWISAEHHRPFDLRTGPLFRAAALRTRQDAGRDGTGVVLALGMHHIVGDGWSTAILIRELLTDYAALTTAGGDPSRNPPSSTPTSPNGRRNGCAPRPRASSSKAGPGGWTANSPSRRCPVTGGPRRATTRRAEPPRRMSSRFPPPSSPGWRRSAATPRAPRTWPCSPPSRWS